MNWQAFFDLQAAAGRPLVMAHRGSSALLPENSPAAFERAVADGADIIETDLHFSHDGEIVLIHDATLDRTVEATGPVGDYTLAELKALRLKQPLERSSVVEHILSLRELIALTDGKIPLALELKDPKFVQPAFAQKLIDLLSAEGMLESVAILSFEMAHLKQVMAQSSQIATGWITLKNPWPQQPVPFLGPFWPLLRLNPFYLSWARRMGKVVCPLDPTPEPRLGWYLAQDIALLISNDPGLTRREIDRHLAPPRFPS